MIVAVGDDGANPELVTLAGGDELDLAHREAELVQGADALVDPVVLARRDRLLARDLAPQPLVALTDHPTGVLDARRLVRLDEGGDPGQVAGHVLHHDQEILGAQPIVERLAKRRGLGVHEVGLELAGVAAEQRVGERAVAPVEAGQVEAHQKPRHGVQQPLAVTLHPRVQEQRPIRERRLQEARDQDAAVAAVALDQPGARVPGRRHGRQLARFEAAQ